MLLSGHQTLPWPGELGLHTGRLLSVRPGEGAGILLEGQDRLLLSLSPPEHTLSSPAPPGPHSVCTVTPSVSPQIHTMTGNPLFPLLGHLFAAGLPMRTSVPRGGRLAATAVPLVPGTWLPVL